MNLLGLETIPFSDMVQVFNCLRLPALRVVRQADTRQQLGKVRPKDSSYLDSSVSFRKYTSYCKWTTTAYLLQLGVLEWRLWDPGSDPSSAFESRDSVSSGPRWRILKLDLRSLMLQF